MDKMVELFFIVYNVGRQQCDKQVANTVSQTKHMVKSMLFSPKNWGYH